MEETERMTALKKAYAEIILNAAKEAAARVIVSERRAQSFQHDLSATKDEALRVLLRIKQMMDFKMNEAETKSLIQEKRIDELEAQLHEAEDIVGNLRAELHERRAELERLSRDQQKPLNGPVHIEETADQEEIEQHQSRLKNHGTSVFTSPLQSQHVSLMECSNSLSVENGCSACYGKDCFAGKTDVTSIIIRSTEPELYRNGCTQRIRACERNILNGHLSLPGQSDNLKCEKLVKTEKGGERIGERDPASRKETMQVEEKNLVHDKEIMNGSKASLRLRKRTLRHKRNGAQKEAESILIKKVSETPDVSQTLASTSDSADYSLNKANNDSKDEEEPNLDGKVPLTIPSERPAAATSETQCVSIAVTDKDMELADALVLIRQEGESKTDVRFRSSEEEKENPTLPLEKSVVQASDSIDAIPIQSPKDRIIKYTFQRKRKRESMGNDDVSSSPQTDIPGQRIRKRLNDAFDSLKSESSRDNLTDGTGYSPAYFFV